VSLVPRVQDAVSKLPPPWHDSELPEEEEANEAGQSNETGDRYENDLASLANEGRVSLQRSLVS
jgi:hypothetical protein